MGTIHQNTLSIVLSDEQLTELRGEIYQMILTETKHVRADMLINVRYLSKKETCEYLGIAYNTLTVWIEMGLPQIVVGGTIRLDRVEIDKWMHKMSEQQRI
ncbi:helix-turn-helix domain-containing protein [Lacticaseibacillus pabuli]|jgi:excisionase family DNA binding protein|uniref:Helix-turn-helix domain-containing protein n=1 Tax=Lacticaseibacillus pabuli TaxID=3025672 RepID=A0ABY7WR92_9LACO|nr:helix-turn-helix domain-containing protein [Lacticaseibacillus sp. KACC 23028]WDF82226.1 helix-turn-helix domain-containing protein [Lacticaseibacillus sp. KACC 23028]